MVVVVVGCEIELTTFVYRKKKNICAVTVYGAVRKSGLKYTRRKMVWYRCGKLN